MRSRGLILATLGALVLVGLGCRELHGPSDPATETVYPALVGRVLDQDGEALPEAGIRLRTGREEGGTELLYQTESDEEGYFSFRLPPAVYDVEIDPPRWSPLPRWTEREVEFDPVFIRIFRFRGLDVRGEVRFGTAPDSLLDLSAGVNLRFTYRHRWPGGSSDYVSFHTLVLGDSYRLFLPEGRRFQVEAFTSCCPDPGFQYTLPDSVEPAPDGRMDLDFPLRLLDLDLRLAEAAVPAGTVRFRSLRERGYATTVFHELETDGVRRRFTTLVSADDAYGMVDGTSEEGFVPLLFRLDGASSLLLDLGSHLLQIHVRSAEGAPVAQGTVHLSYAEGPAASWSVEDGEVPPIRVREGGLLVSVSASDFLDADRYLEIAGDRTVTVVMQPRD